MAAKPATAIPQALKDHWPEYLMEAWGLGTFMVSAGLITTWFEYPGSALHDALPDAAVRRGLIGLAMGLTAIGIIYSPWGRQSGAHINPAVTLAFLRLGKVARVDALFYVVAQFVGGTAGIVLVKLLLGASFTAPPVSLLATVPGDAGYWPAFAAELIISAALMLAVLFFNSDVRLAPFTGMAAGLLVAVFILFEAPLSGTSMNPARTFASAAPGGSWTGAWIYYTAPILGMLAAAEGFRLFSSRETHCAKLYHARDKRCIHCGYQPAHTRREDHRA